MTISTAAPADLQALLELYTHLHNNPLPEISPQLHDLWRSIMSDDNHYIIIGKEDEQIISSCVLVVVPNLTHSQRPYALIENVITHPTHRGNGHASAILAHAKAIAQSHNCYKIMLLTSSKQESTLNFYRRAGYNSTDKTGFICWL